MATFGPIKISITTRDGEEIDDVTWLEDGTDGNGSVIGERNGNRSDIGLSWDNVTIPKDSTINSCTVKIFMRYNNFNSDIDIIIKGFDLDDMSVFSGSNRPSQIAKTTAQVGRLYTDASDWIINTYLTLDDLSSIVQEIVDRTNWSSGNALGFVLEENANTSEKFWVLQDYGRVQAEAAEITIDYTAPSTSNVSINIQLEDATSLSSVEQLNEASVSIQLEDTISLSNVSADVNTSISIQLEDTVSSSFVTSQSSVGINLLLEDTSSQSSISVDVKSSISIQLEDSFSLIRVSGAAPLPISNTSDCKLIKLRNNLGVSTGQVQDLEQEWLISIIINPNPVKDISGLWNEYWDEQAIPSGLFNDRASAWLNSLGYLGDLSQQWNQYWCS